MLKFHSLPNADISPEACKYLTERLSDVMEFLHMHHVNGEDVTKIFLQDPSGTDALYTLIFVLKSGVQMTMHCNDAGWATGATNLVGCR